MNEKSYDGALTAYRIVRAGNPVFDGSGAARWGGRWTGPGRAVIHAAESYALAVLENLVHFNANELPPHLLVCQIGIPKSVSRQVVRRGEVPDFDSAGNYEACRAIGDRWHEEARTALLIVPSRLSPFECNILIHPLHKESRALSVGDPMPARLDERLAGLLSGHRKLKEK
jgi:RES domain-containing protein